MTKSKGQVLSSMNYNTIATAPINFGICLSALRRDAQVHYSTDTQGYNEYIQDNKTNYFVLLNTWYIQLVEYAGKPLPDFLALLPSSGLLQLIKEAQAVSDALIRGEQLPQSLFSSILSHNLGYAHTIQEALQVLRYPKRFSPLHTDSLESECYRDFLNRNNAAKMRDRSDLPLWLASYLREIIGCVLKTYHSSVPVEYGSFSAFPTGVTAEGDHTFVQKFKRMEAYSPFFFGAIGSMRIPKYAHSPRYCKCVSVPKTYKARRIIAEEQTHRQILMYNAFLELDKCIASSSGKYGTANRVTLHDQTRNQQLAKQGSVDGSYATIDLSAASDSVTASLVRQVFPTGVVREWDSLRSEYVDVRSKRYTLYLYSTMGSRLTFPIETILFWSIAVAATETVCRYSHTRFRADMISVYGDDIIVPTFAYDTTVSFLETCGFTVNPDKSFSTGQYRESCGEEYYAGYNVSSKYFPRREILNDGEADNLDVATTVSQLCELQHKLFASDGCNAFLTEVVRLLYPQITYSRVGEKYSDLWSQYLPISYGTQRCAEIVTERRGFKTVRRLHSLDTPLFKDRYFVVDRSGKSTLRYYSSVPVVGRAINCCDLSLKPEYHTTMITKFEGSSATASDVDRLAYIKFLKEGPEYSDALSRLLNVSDKPCREMLGDKGHAKLVRMLY